MSLKFRLNLLVTMLSLGFILAAGWVLVNDTRTAIDEQVEAASHVTLQLLDTVIVSSAMNPSLGPTHVVLQDFLQSLGRVRSSRIELIDHAGNILYTSPKSTFKTDINPPDWFIKLVKPKQEIMQRRIQFGRLFVISNAAGSIREAWSGFRQLLFIGIGFFILINLMVYALLSHALRPVDHILGAINSAEQGDLSARLPHFKIPEFDKIGHSLNRMMQSLNAERELEENRKFTQLIQKHIEDERRSLARELHDELGQYVTAIKTFAVAIANKTKEKAPEVEASAQTIVGAANQIYDGMHNIISQLRPSALDNLGLSETLSDMILTYQKQQPQLDINLTLQGECGHLGENVNINIYRIVQESVNNAIKHAKASKIDVMLNHKTENALKLSISDDGVGMDVDEVDQASHFGLLGIKERVQALNGQFEVDGATNNGTTLDIVIPIETDS